MHSHPNAHLTPRGRARVFAAVEAGMTVSAACIAFRVRAPFRPPPLPPFFWCRSCAAATRSRRVLSGVRRSGLWGRRTAPPTGHSRMRRRLPRSTRHRRSARRSTRCPHYLNPPATVTYTHDPPTSGCHYSLGSGTAPISPGVYQQARRAGVLGPQP